MHVRTCVFCSLLCSSCQKASPLPSSPHLNPSPCNQMGKLVALFTSQRPTLECKAACVEQEVDTPPEKEPAEVFRALCKTERVEGMEREATRRGKKNPTKNLRQNVRLPTGSWSRVPPRGDASAPTPQRRRLSCSLTFRMLFLGPSFGGGGSRRSNSVMDAL